jgi:hypothetical protein
MRSKTFLAVDPGTDYFAWAEVSDGVIRKCGLWGFQKTFFRLRQLCFPGISLCVIETQKVHTAKTKEQVVPLAQAAGGIAYQFPEQRWVWDTTPKRQRWAQTKKRLTPNELALLDGFNKTEQGHIKDALAFAVRYLRR